MYRTRQAWIALLAATYFPMAMAHHSTAAFDLQQIMAIQGVVTRFEWRNPHVYLTVRDQQGVSWLIESDATAILTRSGWTRDSFQNGTSVSVRVYPQRDASKHHVLLLSIAGPDGRQLTSLNRTKDRTVFASEARATTLAGVWSGDPAATGQFLFGAATHSLTQKGRAARNEYREELSPAAQCISWPSPFIVAATDLYLTKIELRNKEIIFRNEFYNTERVVHMNGQHPANGTRTTQGYSIGRWEGSTLVVDTRLFSPHRSPFGGPAAGIPSGTEKHVVERYTLGSDGRELSIDIFMEDPEFLSAPLTGKLLWRYSPHLDLVGMKCDSGSAGRFLK